VFFTWFKKDAPDKTDTARRSAEICPELLAVVEELRLEQGEIVQRAERVRSEFLRLAKKARTGDFQQITAADLALLFRLYDQNFFDGAVGRAVGLDTEEPRLTFRLSKRMTSAAGKLYSYLPRRGAATGFRYELAVSSHLLLSNFKQGRQSEVSGVECNDRVDALQRVFEHELLHLVERLTRGESSCRKEPFRRMSRNIFGHADVTHRLDTPMVKAHVEYGVRVGDLVRFDYGTKTLAGRVNRIGKRATVLVEDAKGLPYTDGKRYRKFYIPLPYLRAAN
jgi:hypothetical protein